ncbi:MAG: hypothetical protein IJP11_01265, partial [Oscillospiraceae bacterium]|nr:hypothetical protein [Oscillospiraceae bacterium]
MDSLFCGKATAVASVHRTLAKSRLKVNCRDAAREGGLDHSNPPSQIPIPTKKEIFTVFAYEFELLQNRSVLVKSFAY